MIFSSVIWFGVSAILGAILTGLVRRHALFRGILDIPNERSSHTQPVPRGGGLAILLIVLIAGIALCLAGLLDPAEIAPVLLGMIIVATGGHIDDVRGLSAGVRAGLHVAAAAITVALLVSFANHPPFPILPTWLAVIVLALGIVWSINLFNFMDGIDGIAASQALFMAAASAGFLLASDGPPGWVLQLSVLAGACGGFLLLNWPPARIFMGDIGSSFIGFFLAAAAVALHLAEALDIWTSVTLGTLFIADATSTLSRRIISGQKWYAAHRSHLYQRLARRFSHRAVTFWLCLLNVAVVLPLASFVRYFPSLGPWLACGVVMLSTTICTLLGAGKPEGGERMPNTGHPA